MKRIAGIAVVLVALLWVGGSSTAAVPVHFIGAGDIAVKGGKQGQTANLIASLNPTAVFALGDTVYPDGQPSGYTTLYAPTWGRFKAITDPVPGNHEYHTPNAAGYFGYFNVPSYYRTTVGSWDVYALNSQVPHGSSSPQVRWLTQQLAAHPTACIIGMWHTPRWSSGKHGSSPGMQPFVNALLKAHADIVLNGHEHNYERFARLNAQGQVDEDADGDSLREFIVGTGGTTNLYGFGSPVTGSRVRLKTWGVLDLGLGAGSYTWAFHSLTGATLDSGSGTC